MSLLTKMFSLMFEVNGWQIEPVFVLNMFLFSYQISASSYDNTCWKIRFLLFIFILLVQNENL